MSEYRLIVLSQKLSEPERRYPIPGDPCGLPPGRDGANLYVDQYVLKILKPEHRSKRFGTTWSVQYCKKTGWFNGYCGSDDHYVDWEDFKKLLAKFVPMKYELEFNLYKVGV